MDRLIQPGWRRSIRPRRYVVAWLVAVMLATSAGTVIGGHVATAVKSYTGCLVKGVVTQVAEGDLPAKACPSGQPVVHFSGGDITAITAGSGLTGGGDNGGATLAIAPAYQLPQGCASAQVAKWTGSGWACAADESASYSAGTGLSLLGTEFSVDADYRLPQDCQRGEAVARVPGLSAALDDWGCTQYVYASESCPSGQFARATSASGELVCSSPTSGGGGEAASATQTAFLTGMGLPDDDTYREVAAASVSAGVYLVTAKGQITSEMNVDDFSGPTSCLLKAGGTEIDYFGFYNGDLDDNAFGHAFALTGVANLAQAGTISLECRAGQGADGIAVRFGRVAALKTG